MGIDTCSCEPKPIEGLFNSDWTTIQLTFEGNITVAGTACNELFTNYASLGTGANCSVKAKYINIILGKGATLSSGGSLNFVPNSIYYNDFCTKMTSMFTSIKVTGNVNIKPVATLLSSLHITHCETYVMKIQYDYTSGRPYTVSMSVSNPDSDMDLSSIQAAISAGISKDPTSIVFSSGLFNLNDEYTFTISVTNFLNNVASFTWVFRTRTSVVLISSPPLSAFRKNQVLFAPIIASSYCGTAYDSSKVRITWDLASFGSVEQYKTTLTQSLLFPAFFFNISST